MKWQQKGREFDELAQIICESSHSYYLWGAAVAGSLFYEEFRERIKICGFLDSDPQKQGQDYLGLPVLSPDEADLTGKRIIITSIAYLEIAETLRQKGFKEDFDFFDSKKFAGIFTYYRLHRLRLDRVDFSITERCTLRCEKCNMFMPFYRAPKHTRLDALIKDIDTLFQWADWVNMLNLLGGEPFLYPHLSVVLEHIERHYKERIHQLELFTNGMVTPDGTVLDLIKRCGAKVQITDYTPVFDYKENLERFRLALERYGIEYTYYSLEKWLDFGFPQNPHSLPEEQLEDFFTKCAAPFRGVYNGRLYYCHLNASAVRAGLITEDTRDYFPLGEFRPEKKKELLEYDLGFSDLGYCTLCRQCRGCEGVNSLKTEGGRQM